MSFANETYTEALARCGCAVFSEREQEEFNQLPAIFTQTLKTRAEHAESNIFRVASEPIYAAYLKAVGEENAAFFKCAHCKHFLERAGTLVTINEDLTLQSLIFDEDALPAGALFAPVVRALREAAESATVQDPATWADNTLIGSMATGAAVVKPNSSLFSHLHATTPARPAEHKAEFLFDVFGVLGHYRQLYEGFEMRITDHKACGNKDVLERADQILFSDGGDTRVPSRKHFKSQLAFLQAVVSGHRVHSKTIKSRKENGATPELIADAEETLNRFKWHAVATAAPGWCAPASSLFGTFLIDIHAADAWQEAEVPVADVGGEGAAVEVKKEKSEDGSDTAAPETVVADAGDALDSADRPPIDFSRYKDAIHALNLRMGGDSYMRPTAAPKAGAVATAERIFEELGLEPALHRRIPLQDEVPLVWAPQDIPTADVGWESEDEDAGGKGKKGKGGKGKKGGVKGGFPHVTLAPQTITMTHFMRKILPSARAVYAKCADVDAYSTFTAPVHADAPPIMKWDCEQSVADAAAEEMAAAAAASAEQARCPSPAVGKKPPRPRTPTAAAAATRPKHVRNGFAFYTYCSLSKASDWALKTQKGELKALCGDAYAPYHEVTGMARHPSTLYSAEEAPSDKDDCVFFFLRGCRETQASGVCIFPTDTRQELHGVRSVIEAVSAKMEMVFPWPENKGQQAAGVMFHFEGAEDSAAGSREVVVRDYKGYTKYTIRKK